LQEFTGRVAVVTGAASGIGRALAEAFAAERMKLVLADVEAEALARAAQALRSRGAEVLAVATDVSLADEVQRLAERTLEAFGAVHVVCNNAGVFTSGLCWETPIEDYAWLLGVNVWGVIHGIRSFVPILLEQGDEGHVVNTASMAAVTGMPFTAAYHMSKHAVLALSESLHHELRMRGARIGVTALCPELVATGIAESERNRPARHAASERAASPARELVEKALREGVARGVAPAQIARRALSAIREGRFYALSEGDGWRAACETRCEDVRLARNPSLVVPEPG
jgi:NAD(P)-dependent dehydrogenase (short-subunit alcohol dehydrogenase family)